MSPQRGSGGAAADKAPNCLPHSDCLPTKASCWSLPCNPLITGEEKELGTGGAEKKGRGGGGGEGGGFPSAAEALPREWGPGQAPQVSAGWGC